MDERGPSRREFLAAGAGGLLAAAAGCVEPGGSRTNVPRQHTAVDVDGAERADGSVYSAVYDAVIDSVAMVSASGVGSDRDERVDGQGSAFVVDGGYLVTNEHVVWNADAISLQYRTGEWTAAEVVGSDLYSDLAVLDVDHVPETTRALAFAERMPVVGQEVLAVGNPYGFDGSMAQGIVSGVDRTLPGPGGYDVPNVVQTDAGVNPGNSGGPLVDLDGEVVGVVNAGIGETIGFAISAALASRVVPGLIADGEYHHSRMGIFLREVGPAVAAANGLETTTGILVEDLQPGGPAEGVLRGATGTVTQDGTQIPVGGDVVIGLDGVAIPDRHTLSKVLALQTSPGDVVEVEVIRDGSITTVDLELGARPTDVDRPY